MGESKIRGVGRGLGSEELGVACADNFGAKFGCERGAEKWRGSLEAHVCRGKGFGGGAAGLCV